MRSCQPNDYYLWPNHTNHSLWLFRFNPMKFMFIRFYCLFKAYYPKYLLRIYCFWLFAMRYAVVLVFGFSLCCCCCYFYSYFHMIVHQCKMIFKIGKSHVTGNRNGWATVKRKLPNQTNHKVEKWNVSFWILVSIEHHTTYLVFCLHNKRCINAIKSNASVLNRPFISQQISRSPSRPVSSIIFARYLRHWAHVASNIEHISHILFIK